MAIEVKIKAVYEEFVTATQIMGGIFGGVMDGMKSELKAMSDQAKTDLKNHESATEQFANVVKSNFKGVNGAIEGVKIAWAQLAVVIGAGALLKGAINDTVKWTDESQKLGRALGVSATEASILKVAIQSIGGTTAEYLALSKGMTAELRTHELAMNKMGLVTRDANGDLKGQQTLVIDGLQALRNYKEGTDRNIAAQTLFGRGVKVSGDILDLNKQTMVEAAAEAQGLNLIVGKEGVEAANEYKKSLASMDGVMMGIKITIVEALMPAVNDLTTWFGESGPSAIIGFKAALNTVIMLIQGLVLAVKILWDVVTAAFSSMVISAKGYATVFTALFKGNYAEALAAAEGMRDGVSGRYGEMFANIVANATATNESLTRLWKNLDGPKVTDSGTSGGAETVDTTETPKVPRDRGAEAAARRAAAEAKRLLKEKYDAQMEIYRRQEEEAQGHWDKVLDIQRKELAAAIVMYGEESKQAEAARSRIAATERQAAAEYVALQQKKAEAARNLALEEVDQAERSAQWRREMGLITTGELLAQERQFEENRYQIRIQGLQEEFAASAERPVEQARIHADIEQLELAHQGRMAEISQQGALLVTQPIREVTSAMGQAFNTVINGMIQKTMTWRDALRTVFSSVLGSLVNMLAQWGARMLTRYALDLIMHNTNAASKAAVDKVSTLSQVTRAAAQAGALGTASFAGAPWPINMGAPAFGLAMFGTALSYAAGASAEGGYDIPAGVNPITQLHQKEMVLPAKHADVIRGMADGSGETGGQRQGDTHNHYNIQAIDQRSVARFFQENGAVMTQSLQRFHGNRGTT